MSEAIARALLDRGAKVDALKTMLNIESASMLAKIGTEKGIMLFGIKRDQKEADFRNQGLGPGDAILISSDLVTGALTQVLALRPQECLSCYSNPCLCFVCTQLDHATSCAGSMVLGVELMLQKGTQRLPTLCA